MGRPDDGSTIEVLCETIVRRYHASLRASLAAIRAGIAAMVASDPPTRLHGLQSAFAHLSDQLNSHLAKEENLPRTRSCFRRLSISSAA